MLTRHKKELWAAYAPGAATDCASACRLYLFERLGVSGLGAARLRQRSWEQEA